MLYQKYPWPRQLIFRIAYAKCHRSALRVSRLAGSCPSGMEGEMAVGKVRGRPRKTERDKREKQVNIRLSEAELAELEKDADVSGRSVSDVVRQRVLGREIAAKVDMVAINELRRQGGLLKNVHLQTKGEHKSETKAAIASLRAAIERVARE